MWVKYHRNQFPIRGTNDTNAAESMFRKIKHFERLRFGNIKPTIVEFLPEMVKILDEQKNKNRNYQNKRLVIHHKNPLYNEALEQASWKLNRIGLAEFHRIIMWFEQ